MSKSDAEWRTQVLSLAETKTQINRLMERIDNDIDRFRIDNGSESHLNHATFYLEKAVEQINTAIGMNFHVQHWNDP